MKKLVFLWVILLIACQEPIQVVENERVKNVEVIEVENKTHQAYASYIGHVSTGTIYKLSLEVSGRIDFLYVSVGDSVDQDMLLASVDTEGLNYELQAAQAEFKAAQAQYSKALESLTYTKNIYDRNKRLHDQGVASDFELEQAELNYRVTQEEVTSARELINQAKVNVEAKNYLLDHSELYSDHAGIVMDILYETGEVTSAGYPIILLREAFPMITFGVAQEDLQYLKVGKSLEINIMEDTIIGSVRKINQVPDTSTQTYEVEVAIDHDYPIGSFASIDIPTLTVKGSKLPLSAIRSDGQDYVFIVENQRAKRVNIEVVDIHNQEVIVSGLPETCILVTEGIMILNSGDLVKEVDYDSTH